MAINNGEIVTCIAYNRL